MRETEPSRTRLTKDCSLVAALLRALRHLVEALKDDPGHPPPGAGEIVTTELSGIDLPGVRLAAI